MEHILLVEDDPALGQGIAMALQIPETAVTVCRSLGEARQALLEKAFLLLILDVNLPDGSGLADEPTGNLDSKTSQDVLGLMKVTSQRFSQTMVMITHNEEIAQMADRIVRIEDGRIVKR